MKPISERETLNVTGSALETAIILKKRVLRGQQLNPQRKKKKEEEEIGRMRW